MKHLLAHIKAAYIFLFIALGTLIVSVMLLIKYQNTRNEIFQINKALNLQYVQGLAKNLSEDILRIIDSDFYDEISSNALVHDYIEADLRLFITTKFKDIRLLVKAHDSARCVIIAEGNAAASRPCAAHDSVIFTQIDSNGMPHYEVDNSAADVWATYYAPIISHGKVQAVILINFSMFEQRTILDELAKLGDLIESLIVFFIVIFLLILWFAYFDFRREEHKNRLLQKLEASNRELNEKTGQLARETQKTHELFVQASQNLAMINEAQHIAKVGSFDHYLDKERMIFSEENYAIWELAPEQTVTPDLLLSRIHPEDIEAIRQQITTQMEHNSDSMFSFRIRVPDGGEKHILARVSSILNEEGTFIGVRGTHQDISDKVRAELKEKEQNLLIMHQNRLAMQGEMLEMIAHQWRQPLNTLSLTLLSLYIKIANIPDVPDEVGSLHEKAEHAIQYLSRTIDDFKSFFANDKATHQFSPSVLLDDTLSIVENHIQRYGIVVEKIYDEAAEMRIDSFQSELAQAVLAILNNAIDALKEVQVERTIRIRVSSVQNDHVLIEISDNAGGIPNDVLPYIFDPYFSTKKDKNGTGLGLYMVKMIMEDSLRGSIEAKAQGSWAVFTLHMPTTIPKP